MNHDHHDRDAGPAGRRIAGFDRTPGSRVRCSVRHRHTFVLDRS
ncbi:hypothetical protein [Burkholderia paludis]|nr:hypothetical protein [Burkholderia paludis]